jgi:hypothetical protein
VRKSLSTLAERCPGYEISAIGSSPRPSIATIFRLNTFGNFTDCRSRPGSGLEPTPCCDLPREGSGMSGRSKFRKTSGEADAHFEELREQLEAVPASASDDRFEIRDFVVIEAGRTVAAFNVYVSAWRATIGRCLWRGGPTGAEWIELPPHIGFPDHAEHKEFLEALLAVARAHARSLYTERTKQ